MADTLLSMIIKTHLNNMSFYFHDMLIFINFGLEVHRNFALRDLSEINRGEGGWNRGEGLKYNQP